MNKHIFKFLVACFLLFYLVSCTQIQEKEHSEECAPNEDLSTIENLYISCVDSLVRSDDTMSFHNSLFDTTVIETGIFAKLLYDFPLWVDDSILILTRKAVEFEKANQHNNAIEIFRKIILYSNSHFPYPKPESDWVSYYRHAGNTAMLISYAHERTGNIEMAIEVLKPYLNKIDWKNIKIRERFFAMLIKIFGKDRVKKELNESNKTVFCKDHEYAQDCDWAVSLFDTDIVIAHKWEHPDMNPAAAFFIIQRQDFYKLVE